MFVENNQPFSCIVCGKQVKKHPTSSRNHCNWCLTSLHVDIEPGDRKNTCKGVMKPIGIETKEGKTQIVYVCTDCGKRGKNVVAPDDNMEEIIAVSTSLQSNVWKLR